MQKVTIVIPCYNHAQYLPEAIESALAQTIPCEVIVVNDGSTDNSSEIAKKYPVKVIDKENGGLSSARNAGIKEATGEWILTLDSDDKIDPKFIEKTIGKNDIVATGQQEFGDTNRAWFPRNEIFHELFQFGNQINCCSLYKKKVWETIGGYDENMREGYEDWDFWYRATKAGFKISVVPELLFFYRKHGTSMVTHAIKNHDRLKQYILCK